MKEQFEAFRERPFPSLGYGIGEFPLYDALIAGLAQRVARGQRVEPSQIPEPDEETAREVERLRAADEPTEEEREFLAYYDELERLRDGLRAG